MANISTIKISGTTYNIDAVTVAGHTVAKDVPSNAVFTDNNTTYSAASNEGLSLSNNAFSMATQTGAYVGASSTTPQTMLQLESNLKIVELQGENKWVT